MNEVKHYCELQAIARFYQFKEMKTNTYKTKKEKQENERVFNLWIEKLKELELIQDEKKNDTEFWEAVDKYRYENAEELINAERTFNLQ